MVNLYKRPICLITGLLVPLITLASPNWLSLSGVAPNWSILWLLPWAMLNGPLSAAIAGLLLGLALDALNLGGASHAPVLFLLGLWWGNVAQRGPKVEGSLKLGLLAWIGSVFLGFSICIQIFLFNNGAPFDGFFVWGLNTLLSKAIITGLLAPIVSSWLLLAWTRR